MPETILDESERPVTEAFVIVRRLKRKQEFFDVNTVATVKQTAFLKAAAVDEMKPEFAKRYPVIRVAQIRMIEVKPQGQERE